MVPSQLYKLHKYTEKRRTLKFKFRVRKPSNNSIGYFHVEEEVQVTVDTPEESLYTKISRKQSSQTLE